MKCRTLFRNSLLTVFLAAPVLAHAGVLYTVTVVGGANSAAYDVNELGQVVGTMAAGSFSHGFYYDGAVLRDIGTLGGGNSGAWRLNDSGVVVGTSETAGPNQGFRYSGGVMTSLPLTGPSEANDINNAGAIVGSAVFTNAAGEQEIHAYTYLGGIVTDLGTLPVGDRSLGEGINEAGHVAGTVVVGGAPNHPTDPFFYKDGVMVNLGNVGGVFSNGWALNNKDQVVGSLGLHYQESSGNLYPYHAFMWEAGTLHDLGAFTEDGNSSAYDINDKGQIVGRADTAAGVRGFLYSGGKMVELDSLIDPASGWTIESAGAINEREQIAATACKAGICYAVRLDLAMAVPEPAQTWLFLAGGILVTSGGALGRRRRSGHRNAEHAGTIAA